jgi:hypothetical protein
LVGRISWAHLQCACASSLSWTNAWLLTNFRGNMFISLSYLLWIIFLFTDYDSVTFLQDIEPAPLARTISYNIAGPISALGYQSPTLARLMSRYATLEPILISSTSDKRKAPSLIAPPTAKRKRTSKKLLIQVRIPCPPEYNVIL